MIRNMQTNDPLVIIPPTNTSYFILNATVYTASRYFGVWADPPLPGRQPNVSDEMNLYFDTAALSNVRAFETPLDPEVEYKIYVAQNITRFSATQNPIFNAVTFYSALW